MVLMFLLEQPNINIIRFTFIKDKSKGAFYLGEIVARSNKAGLKILEKGLNKSLDRAYF